MTEDQPHLDMGDPDGRLRRFFTTLPTNLLTAFTGRHALWQLTAIALTAVSVLSGFDWFYFEHTRAIPSSAYLPALVMGGLAPIVVPLGLMVVGRGRCRGATVTLGLALAQAAAPSA